jgi:hypothetical protein
MDFRFFVVFEFFVVKQNDETKLLHSMNRGDVRAVLERGRNPQKRRDAKMLFPVGPP